MKTLVVLLILITGSGSLGYCQTNLVDAYDFNATCVLTTNDYANQVFIYLNNDSIVIKARMSYQCCAIFSLQKSEEVRDTVFVLFKDTASLQCDCMCKFDIRINMGKYYPEISKVNFNGNYYDILAEDYKPLAELNKRWNVLNLIPGLEYSFPKLYEYSIDSDKGHFFCWNGISYLKVTTKMLSDRDEVNLKDTLPKYIREENGKVYLLDSTDIAFDGCNEFLLYDFTAKAGDYMYLGYDSIMFYVTETGYDETIGRRWLKLNDVSRPILAESSILPPPETLWIEGIGDTRGLFESKKSLFVSGTYNKLSCCHLKDSLLYSDPEYPDCGVRPPYEFFIQDGKKWTFIRKCWIPFNSNERIVVKIDTSNLLNNPYAMRFYPFPANQDVYFQEENGRIFYQDYTERYKIYDFTLNKGDSVLVGRDVSAYLYVDSVQYLQYKDTVLRKTIFLSGSSDFDGRPNRVWIEGVGDPYSPLYYWFPIPTNGCFEEFACCALNDELIYQNPNYPHCGVGLSIDNKQLNPIKLYPNPSYGNIKIEYSGDINGLDYTIYNVSGQIIEQGNLNEELELNLGSGIYIIDIIREDRLLVRRNLIIY